MRWGKNIAITTICILLSTHTYALDLHNNSPSPLLIPDTSQRYVQYSLRNDAAFSPYVSVGEEEPIETHWDTYWRDHSYESSNQPKRGNAWAGVKVKLTKMLNLDVDTNTRHVRSSVNLSPKLKMKVRVKFTGIKADFVYRY